MSRLCLFDLDRTLVEGRTIERLADHFGLSDEVASALDRRGEEPAAGVDESARIIALFEGVDAAEFAQVCADLTLREGAEEVVARLKDMGFRVGVVTASYQAAAEACRERLGLDFAVAAEPETKDGLLTGRLLPSEHVGDCGTFICKERVLLAYAGLEGEPTVAVGDGMNDLCMMEVADVGIAVEPCPLTVRLAADVVVRDLRAIPAVVQQRLSLMPIVAH